MNPLLLIANWRVWLLAGVLGAVAASGIYGYRLGEKSTQATFDAYKLAQEHKAMAAEEAARQKETELQLSNQQVTQNYESLKTATATAVRALDADRMRLQSALAARSGEPAKDSSAIAGTDADPEGRILSECLDRYASVAGDADGLSAQVKALQDYISKVLE